MEWKKEEIKGEKKREQGEASDWISEHIAHYSPRRGCEIFSQLELAVEVLTACDVVGSVCMCVCVCKRMHILLLWHWCQPETERERRGVAESKKENNFLALCFRRCNDPSSSSMKVTWRVTAETDVALLDKRHARQDEERYFSELFSVLFTLCSNNQSCLRTCLSSANSVRLMLQGNEQKIQVDRSSADL